MTQQTLPAEGEQKPAAPVAQKPSQPQSIEQVFKNQLTNYESTIVKLISDTGISANKFMEMAYTAVRKTPDLLQCDRASLFGAILAAAELGLMPNTNFGYCYILPYNNKDGKLAQFQIGYQGLIQLMYRVPEVKTVSSERVFSKDEFEYEIFPVKKITKHKPYIPKDEKDSRGFLIATYAVVQLENVPEPLFEITFKAELDKIKSLSKAGNSAYSPYNSGTDVFNWMERKVPIKQIFKTMRKETSPNASKGFEIDDIVAKGGVIKADENGNTQITYVEGFTNKKRSATDRIVNAEDTQIIPEDGAAN
jgi:phage RecT family recombinase